MELQGKIIASLEPKSGTSSRGEWVVQEFVLEIPGTFTRKMVFSVFGAENLQKFNIQVGQDVSVFFDIDAREYNGRWFNSIRAYDVRQVMANAAAGNTSDAAPIGGFGANTAATPFAPVEGSGSSDDLPF